ncbi:MAG: hypothetical protein QOH64_1170 [Acidimicrobiaceae bacterium]
MVGARAPRVPSATVSRRLLLPALLVVITLAACGSSGPDRAGQGRAIAEGAGLPKDVADFFAAAAAPAASAFRVAYDSNDQQGKPSQLTLTQKPPQRRVDVFHPDGSIDSTIATGGRSYQCTMTGSTWECGALGTDPAPQLAGGVFDPDAVRKATEAFRQRAADYDFRVETRTVAGAQARCLVTTRKPGAASDASQGATATLCLSAEGAQLLAETPTGRFEAKEYTTTIPTDAFDLPAPAS